MAQMNQTPDNGEMTQQEYSELVAIRRDIHAHPETGMREMLYKTIAWYAENEAK